MLNASGAERALRQGRQRGVVVLRVLPRQAPPGGAASTWRDVPATLCSALPPFHTIPARVCISITCAASAVQTLTHKAQQQHSLLRPCRSDRHRWANGDPSTMTRAYVMRLLMFCLVASGRDQRPEARKALAGQARCRSLAQGAGPHLAGSGTGSPRFGLPHVKQHHCRYSMELPVTTWARGRPQVAGLLAQLAATLFLTTGAVVVKKLGNEASVGPRSSEGAAHAAVTAAYRCRSSPLGWHSALLQHAVPPACTINRPLSL